jgi:hypothetical protein
VLPLPLSLEVYSNVFTPFEEKRTIKNQGKAKKSIASLILSHSNLAGATFFKSTPKILKASTVVHATVMNFLISNLSYEEFLFSISSEISLIPFLFCLYYRVFETFIFLFSYYCYTGSTL